jgi:type I pantothenate kinase
MASDFSLNDVLHTRAAAARAASHPFVIGVAGSVAVGKSTFAAALAKAIAAWPEHPRVESLATDGFLFPNAVLAERGIAMRKGYPESYDVEALRIGIASIKAGHRTALPRYSHVTYDVDTDNPLIVERPDVIILDGLHLAQIERPGAPRLIDCLIYLDADEAVIENWFTARLLPLMLSGREDPKSFYHRFREMDDAARRAFAAGVWQTINLPNLRDNIVKDRDAADVVVAKAADHGVTGYTPRAPIS